MSIDEKKFLRGIEDLLKYKKKKKTEEGFKPKAKPSNESKARNFRGKKSSFSKGKPSKKIKVKFSKTSNEMKPNKSKNKKKGSKAKTRWKKSGKT